MSVPSVQLNNGVEMPSLGFGTWNIADGKDAYEAVRAALAFGYRLIDTAAYYRNERSVGKAVRESGIPRSEIFLTTKLWPSDFDDPKGAFDKSSATLDVGVIDLYLVHWPAPDFPKRVWKTLESLYEQKLVRAIGISNFGIGDIEQLLAYAHVPPAVDQIKFNPFDFAEEVLSSCKAHDIVAEAYSPLTRGSQLHHSVVSRIAGKYQRTPAQVMLRWCIEHGTVPLPKTIHPERMKENIDVFGWRLDAADMEELDALS